MKPYHQFPDGRIYLGDCRKVLRKLPAASIQCIVTSPPYYALRDYGVAGQIGEEASVDAYVRAIVDVFAHAWRVLRDDGTLWLNLGDTYGKDKQLLGVPWRVAFALQQAGWILRSEIIWCLSGGTVVYARTQKGDMPLALKDLYRLDPSTVKLWNGKKWTQLRGMSRQARKGNELELVLRSGEVISCSANHRFPCKRGLKKASDLRVGDCLKRVKLPAPEKPKFPKHITKKAAWLAGLFIAEGSRSGDTLQLSGHSADVARLRRVRKIVRSYGGYVTCTNTGNCQNIRIYGKVVNALISELVAGRTSKDKGLAPVCWRYGNDFLQSLLDGYLSGDGGLDRKNNRWILGFTRNYRLAQDLRTLAARLGYKIRLSPRFATAFGKRFPTFRGELRQQRTGHWNEKDYGEILVIRKARCRYVYDVGVEDSHLFAIASGILTHNSKPNPMPESADDRPTRAHEQIFLFSKRPEYYYDAEAIREERVTAPHANGCKGGALYAVGPMDRGGKGQKDDPSRAFGERDVRNKRSVWSVPLHPYKGAHFATFPKRLIVPCIQAGTPEMGVCKQCGAPQIREVTSKRVATRPGTASKVKTKGKEVGNRDPQRHIRIKTGERWVPGCKCKAGYRPARVLDPFFGAGTTGVVCRMLGRRFSGIELNPEYADQAARRLGSITPGAIGRDGKRKRRATMWE